MRTIEPMWWALFSAGGTIAAFLFPALLLVTGLAVPNGWIPTEGLYAFLGNPWTRLMLFVAISLPLFHAAHRIRHTLAEMGLKDHDRSLSITCYGLAILGTLIAGTVLTFRN